MASSDGDLGSDPSLGQKSAFEWPVAAVCRLLVTNRNVGSPSSINIMLTFPNAGCLDMGRLTARVAEVQQLWPLLSITIADQRTPSPKMQYRYSAWDAEQILAHETYDVNAEDPQAERDGVYEKALRLFQAKVAFGSDPLWRVTVFRASSPDADAQRVYLALTLDHIIIDGRGAVKLAAALVADDISQLPREDIEIYRQASIKQDAGALSYLFILAIVVREMLIPRLPDFARRWLGYPPVWPQRVPRPTIDSPWRSSILEVPADLMRKLKDAGKRHGVVTLNPTLHTAWVVAVWAVLVRRGKGEKDNGLAMRDCSVKDLRDVADGDPYCLSGNATMYLWSSGLFGEETRFWPTARAYAAVSVDPRSYAEGGNMMKLVTLAKDAPVDPETTAPQHRAPDSAELPAGDKRAHTRAEATALRKINSDAPYMGLSGIWSNLSYMALPRGASDMVFGVSGNATGTAFNTCVVGHENGVRLQNAYSDGAAMAESQVKRAEALCLRILEKIADADAGGGGEGDWCLGDLIVDV